MLSLDPVSDPSPDWIGSELRRTAAVYGDLALLWRSARCLLGVRAITVPDTLRDLVETAYDADREGAIPPGLAAATDRTRGEWSAARGIAEQNLLPIDRPYQRDAGLWEPDERTPTRLGEKQIVLRLARIVDGALQPWCADPDPSRAWLSEIGVRAARVSGPAPDQALADLIEATRRRWPGWAREIPVLVLREEGDARTGACLDAAQRPLAV